MNLNPMPPDAPFVRNRKSMPEYHVWTSLVRRCTNPRDQRWAHYGGRGISVCARWRSFDAFFNDIGPRPTPQHSIDRINNDGDYELSNCRWATVAEQQSNKRSCRILTVDGTSMTVSEWERAKGFRKGTIKHRLYAGWTPEAAVRIAPALPPPLIRHEGKLVSLAALARAHGLRPCTVQARVRAGWPAEKLISKGGR